MINLFSFCDFPWWLTWLLPFLLGLALGYLLWARYKAMISDLENQINQLNLRIGDLEAALKSCNDGRSLLEGDLTILRGKLRESELELSKALSLKDSGAALSANLTSSNAASVVPDKSDAWFTAIGIDNLQIIEGIGPKMQEVLNENGIHSFSVLASKTPEELRAILDKYKDRYRIIDPSTWAQQATIADSRQWNELIALQKSLDTGRGDTDPGHETDSKLEKWLIKHNLLRAWKTDDLKAVEGIGVKIEELLHNAGIHSWKALASTPTEKLQEILTAAGPRFSLADSGTWAQQADLAAQGKWNELKALQDILVAGREKK